MRPLTEIDSYIERNRERRENAHSFLESSAGCEQTSMVDDILEHFLQPTSVIQTSARKETSNQTASLDELQISYAELRITVVEFERKISTLRASAKTDALTLARLLVTRNAMNLFKTLRDFQPQTRPKLHMTDKARDRMQRHMDNVLGVKTSRSLSTLKSLLAFGSKRPKNGPMERPSARERTKTRRWARKWEQMRMRAQAAEQFGTLLPKEEDGFVVSSLKTFWLKFRLRWNRLSAPAVVPRWFLKDLADQSLLDDSEFRDFEDEEGTDYDREIRIRSVETLAKKKNQNWVLDWAWELDWDREWDAKEEQKWQETRAKRWNESVDWPSTRTFRFWRKSKKLSWNTDYVARLQRELDWLDQDRKSRPDEWDDNEWLTQQFWWKEFRSWMKRWEERKRAVDAFTQTCLALAKDLENIDGSALAEYSNVFPRSGSSDFSHLWEHRQDLDRYIAEVRDAMQFLDRGRFIGSCNAMFRLISVKLQSDNIEKGAWRLGFLLKKQDYNRSSFMNIATIAIFFSSITATTLQFSFAYSDLSIASGLVNGLWLSSLVFSITSAIVGFLAGIVHQSTEFLQPSHRLSHQFLLKSFKIIPSSLLAIAGALFMGGLCAFTQAPTGQTIGQGVISQTVVLVLTSSMILMILVMLLWAFKDVLHVGFKISAVFLSIFLFTVLYNFDDPFFNPG